MTHAVKGFVAKIFKKEGTSKKGPWTAYSFKVELEDGNEDPYFYQFGFSEPPFAEGDYIQFSATDKDDRARTYTEGSGKIVKNAPARSQKEKSGSGGGGGRGNYGGGGAKVKTSELFGEIGGYNTEDDIRRMSYSAARGDAVTLVAAMLEHKALPMSEAQTKAGVAKRFEAISEMVDKFTVEFFFDSASGRKLETVADGGVVNVAADAPVPDTDAPAVVEDDSAADELPPEDDGDVSF